jgi:hypothetical protein
VGFESLVLKLCSLVEQLVGCSYANDVLACSVTSDLVAPFVTFAVKCFKAGVFNDNLIAVTEKALTRFSTIYQRHALVAKVRAAVGSCFFSAAPAVSELTCMRVHLASIFHGLSDA